MQFPVIVILLSSIQTGHASDWAALPEFEALRNNTKSAPKRWNGNFARSEFSPQLVPFLFQQAARRDHLLCWETHAPNWLPRGRDAKYLSDSAVEIFSDLPLISNCRKIGNH